MKFLFQDNRISLHVSRLAVMLKIFLYHFICYVACTPYAITNSPKMPAPISLGKCWIFLLQSSRGSTLQSLYNITYIKRWTVLNMNMYMIFANYSLKNPYVLRIANLLNKFPTSFLNISFQNFIPVFCNPNYVGRKPRYCMATNTLIFTHMSKLNICVATESLALKAHSFN